jgi:hypothetical protein
MVEMNLMVMGLMLNVSNVRIENVRAKIGGWKQEVWSVNRSHE